MALPFVLQDVQVIEPVAPPHGTLERIPRWGPLPQRDRPPEPIRYVRRLLVRPACGQPVKRDGGTAEAQIVMAIRWEMQ